MGLSASPESAAGAASFFLAAGLSVFFMLLDILPAVVPLPCVTCKLYWSFEVIGLCIQQNKHRDIISLRVYALQTVNAHGCNLQQTKTCIINAHEITHVHERTAWWWEALMGSLQWIQHQKPVYTHSKVFCICSAATWC